MTRAYEITTCPDCGGTGQGERPHDLCPFCQGTGKIEIPRQLGKAEPKGPTVLPEWMRTPTGC